MDSSPSPSQSTWSSESVAKVKERYCVQVESMTSKGERYPYGGLQVKAELSHDGAVVPGEVEDHGDGTYTITLTSGPHQLLITLDEQVIKCSSGPCSIAIHDSGDIYVSCWSDHRIPVFDDAGQQKKTIGSVGRCDGQVNYPSGLFIKGNMFFQWPQGLAIDPQGNIHVANDNTIEVFTSEGTFVISYGDVKNPFGIVIDEEGADYCIYAEVRSLSIPVVVKPLVDGKAGYIANSFRELVFDDIGVVTSDEDADTPETSTVCFGNNSCSATKITWCQRTSKCVQIAGGGVQGNKASTEFFYQEAVILVGVPKWCKQRQALVSGDGCREVCESDSKEEGTEEGKEKKVKEEEDGEGDEDGQEIFKQDWNKFLDLQ
eukprot:Em0024g264a